jgi:uncharacterized membrane protein YjfL (UPF0719 family)
METFSLNYPALALSLVQVMLGVAVLIIAKLAAGVLSPYAIDRELTSLDNPAFGLAISGYYAATVIIYLGAAGAAPLPLDEGATLVFAAVGRDLLWSIAGIACLNFSRWLMDRLLVSGVRNAHEITKHRNLAAGALECGAYVAAGVILAGAIRQPSGTLWTAAILFLLGQFALIVMGHVYQNQRWSSYNVAAEIRSGNFAAGIAFALTLVALSLLMLKAISGEFTSWATTLSFFAFDTVSGMLLLMFLRWLTDLALLPGARIKAEIVRDRNVNAGLIEGVLAVGIAAIILFVF